jgi:Kef-type K+ transport system membrane component KefB
VRSSFEDPSIDIFARIGALVLLFDVGLELTVRDVFAVGRSAIAVAVSGTIASLIIGTAVASALRADTGFSSHFFLGAALTSTSIGITARVLKDLGKTRDPEARVILGAAIIDDVLGLVILALVTGSLSAAGSTGGSLGFAVATTIAKTIAFFAIAFFVGSRTAPYLFAAVAKLRTSGAQVGIGLALCFLHAWIADAIGLAPIVGAFTAGLLLDETHSARFIARGERSLRELVEPVSSFLVPVFFVVMGAGVDLRALGRGSALVVALALTVAAIAGKLACAAGASGVRRLPVAVGMIPRGEVTLIYASLGRTIVINGKPLLDDAMYSALVFVVIATTLVTPGAIKWIFQPSAAPATKPAASRAP